MHFERLDHRLRLNFPILNHLDYVCPCFQLEAGAEYVTWGFLRQTMPRNAERESLREILMEVVPEFVAVLPCHLSGCQKIADCFMVNRQTFREWRMAGAPIAMIGGSANGAGAAQ